jgi:hypothetical protein
MTTEDFDLDATRAIPGFPNYRAGRDGSIWSRPRKGSAKHWTKLTPDEAHGYLGVRVREARKKRDTWLPVHKAVLLAFKGESPEGRTECCHRNGDRKDNHPDNLYWGNRKDQLDDQLKHRSQPSRTKLTPYYVWDLRRRQMKGEVIDIQAEANEKMMSPGAIKDALSGKTWKHIDPSVQLGERAVLPTGHQNPGSDKLRMTRLEELMNLWCQLTKCEQQEFLLKVGTNGSRRAAPGNSSASDQAVK